MLDSLIRGSYSELCWLYAPIGELEFDEGTLLAI